MKVLTRPIQMVDRQAWNAHVNKTSGNPTQLYEFALTRRGKAIPIFLEIEDNGAVVFRWLMFFAGLKYMGNLTTMSEPTNEEQAYLVAAMGAVIRKYHPCRVIFYNMATSFFRNQYFFQSFKKSRVYEYESLIIELQRSEEELWQDIHQKHRNVIRKAQKGAVFFRESTSLSSLEKFYELSVLNYAKSNAQIYSYESLRSIFDVFSKSRNVRIFQAELNDQIQAMACILMSDKNAYYWKGTTVDNPFLGSSNKLQWEIIKYLKKHGYQTYILGLGPTTLEKNCKGYTIKRFKQRFGKNIVTCYGGTITVAPLRNFLCDWMNKFV